MEEIIFDELFDWIKWRRFRFAENYISSFFIKLN